ncbi:NAD(P)-dependent dehydrogenase (short-subunit alcohol dehydrogenase family) [Evansella vedderi]|uniref:NAD(P)-dependent dehydrogenase (Short-subunit alcohol dehydrogenase family) n=1 Tax=Evansella vedderi TaxID=38282 RepID=A0ABU0A0G1_9BACI|nr:SDR family oxidoreductase [Evansella vedderi]MDQ0256979.1 NAD(P)-dependent dehydrogenase (short-subunit alcohol dehydrogenase family) [Evansella vedderi]
MYPQYPYYDKEVECEEKPISFPPQHQEQHPGLEYPMVPRPIAENPNYTGSHKLHDKVAIITGGDSGIGRAAAIAFAKEGAHVVIVYYNEHRDAEETKERIHQLGRSCLTISGDLKEERFSYHVVQQTMQTFGQIDILVNNAAVQYPKKSILDISTEQLETTFRTNIFSFFHMTKAVLPYLQRGSTIINNGSVTAFRGHKKLIDYSASQGAVITFTRSLAMSLVDQEIRVNAVAPGPIWTPLIPSSFEEEDVKTFGTRTPMERAGQPFELAPTFVYLASDDSSYITGQVIHVNGGEIVGS